MSRLFIVILIGLLLVLGGYGVYSALPLLPKNHLFNINSAGSPFPTPSPAPASDFIIPTPANDFTNSLIITTYLQNHLAITGFDGEAYCTYKLLSNPVNTPSVLYLLFLCQEYYSRQDTILPGTGLAAPVSLNIGWDNGLFSVTGHQLPEMGSRYNESVQNLFPPDIVKYLKSDTYSADLLSLQQHITSVIQ